MDWIWHILGAAGFLLACVALGVAIADRHISEEQFKTHERMAEILLTDFDKRLDLFRREVQSLESRIATVREDSLASIKRLSELEANVKIDDPSWPVLRSYGERGPEVRDVHAKSRPSGL